MARKTAATTKGKSVVVTQTQAISRLKFQEDEVRTAIGFPRGTKAENYARVFMENFKDGMINKESLPPSIIKDIDDNKPPKAGDIHMWVNNTIAKAKSREIVNMLPNADPVTYSFLTDQAGYKSMVDVNRNTSLPIQTDGEAEIMTKEPAFNLGEGSNQTTDIRKSIVRKPLDVSLNQNAQFKNRIKRRDEILERLNVIKNAGTSGFSRREVQALNVEFEDIMGQTVPEYNDSLTVDSSAFIKKRNSGPDPFEERGTDASVKKPLSTSNIRDGMIRGLQRSPNATKKLIALVNTNRGKAVSDLMKNLTDRGVPVTSDIASDMLDQILTRITSE